MHMHADKLSDSVADVSLNNPETLCNSWIITGNKWTALLLHVSSILSFVLLSYRLHSLQIVSLSSLWTHDLCSHAQQSVVYQNQFSASDSTSEACEEPQPGAAFELQGGAFDASPLSSQSCLSSPRYARQGFLASAAWECSPDEPLFTTCLLRSAHRKLEGKKVRPKLFYLKFTVYELSWLGCPFFLWMLRK